VLTVLNEQPYVEMTLAWLDRLGIHYINEDFKRFRIPGRQLYRKFEYSVPADFSSATFFLCAGALAGREVELAGLDMNDTQGDKAVIDYLRKMGARIDIGNKGIIVGRGELRGAELDLKRNSGRPSRNGRHRVLRPR